MFKKTILFSVIFSLFFLSACGVKKEKELSLEEAKVKAEQFINDNFMEASSTVKIGSIEDDPQTGLYKFSIDLGDGQLVDSYISKDGKKLFPQAYDMKELEKTINEDGGDGAEVSDGNFNESADFNTEKKVAIYFFWGDGCPHCASQKTIMSQWAEKYPDVEIKTYETWKNESNGKILENLATAYGTTVEGVPMTFIGDKYWVGYSESLGVEMESKIEECLKKDCENPGKRIK